PIEIQENRKESSTRESEAQGENDLRECFNNGRLRSSPSRQREARIIGKINRQTSKQNLLFHGWNQAVNISRCSPDEHRSDGLKQCK
ncbi:hypothetical protein NPIL_648481, partial [Nephila pilipes]